jgi:hypothetical protein
MSFSLSPVRLGVGDPADEQGASKMQYLLMIYQNEAEYAKLDTATSQKIFAEYQAFTQSIIQSGNFKGGDRLQPASTATTVRVREGKTLTTDGPFAETREQLGGYYMIEAKDLDAAISIAARIPGARHGCIEVRPVWVYK